MHKSYIIESFTKSFYNWRINQFVEGIQNASRYSTKGAAEGTILGFGSSTKLGKSTYKITEIYER